MGCVNRGTLETRLFELPIQSNELSAPSENGDANDLQAHEAVCSSCQSLEQLLIDLIMNYYVLNNFVVGGV